jgi:beta-lactamase class D
LEKLKITNKEQAEQIDKLKQKQSEFKALCDEITLVEYPNDPYKII